MNFDLHVPHVEMRPLEEVLETLRDAQLVSVSDEADPAFQFKHALVQDAIYKSLLNSERRDLHKLTAQAIERLEPERADQNAALLAYHYERARQDTLAVHYALRAGDYAAQVYADAEALAAYSRAIAIGKRSNSGNPLPYARRGRLHERAGNFDQAHADIQIALELAHAQHDSALEWECLVSLGFLWTARDYARTGEYFRQALSLATATGSELMVAHSLNRLGNWYVNTEKITDAFQLHERALEIFQNLNDKRGIAESYDLLGMCSIFEGDAFLCGQYYTRAIDLWREIGDLRGLASSQISYAFLHRNYDTDLIVTETSFDESVPAMLEALQRTQDIGWRAGESFTSWLLGISYASQGQYLRALAYAERGLEIAQEIQHHQWIAGALCAVGAIHAELLDAEYAQAHLERGLKLARALNSMYWTHMLRGWLGIALVGQQKLDAAHTLLDDGFEQEPPMATVSQRRLWSARILLALAERDAERALEWCERLVQTARYSDLQVIPMIGYMQARALAQLGAHARAREILDGALAQAHRENLRPVLWRLYGTLSSVLAAQGDLVEADRATAAARAQVRMLAQGMSDAVPDLVTGTTRPLQTLFETRALERIERWRASP